VQRGSVGVVVVYYVFIICGMAGRNHTSQFWAARQLIFDNKNNINYNNVID
jgi:hypothetical protein